MVIAKAPLFNQLGISVFGATSLMLACIGPTLLFPFGLIFFCVGLPLSVVFFLWAWVPETRFDDQGVTQRNLWFQTQTLAWRAVDSVRLDSYTHESRGDDGWARRTNRRVIEIIGGAVKIHLDMPANDTTAWHGAALALIRQHVPAEKIS